MQPVLSEAQKGEQGCKSLFDLSRSSSFSQLFTLRGTPFTLLLEAGCEDQPNTVKDKCKSFVLTAFHGYNKYFVIIILRNILEYLEVQYEIKFLHLPWVYSGCRSVNSAHIVCLTRGWGGFIPIIESLPIC